MNLIFICKKFEEKEENLINEIKNLMESKLKKDIKIGKKEYVDNRFRADVFIILDKENVDISEYFINKKNNNLNKVIVLLNKITEKNIIKVCNYTKNICYINNDISVICKRIYKIYLDGCEIFDEK